MLNAFPVGNCMAHDPQYDFSGQTAIITGGARGIGRAVAAHLLRSGAQVWIWDIDPVELKTGEIRPDWDLSTPGLREAWNAGDLSRFHGWNKHAGEEEASIARKK